MSNVPSGPPSPHREFLGHPLGLYICFLTEMWERFSFYGMKTLLLLYLTKYHLFTDDAGYLLLGTYGGLAYALPVVGGIMADRYLGMRKAVVFGGVLLCLGHFGMAFEGTQAARVGDVVQRDEFALSVFYLSLALIIMGVGFLKPNISTIVGRLYRDDDPRRDSGFTLFYMGINIGAFLSSLVCGWLGETYGWKYGFGAAGVGMLAGLILFLWGQRYLQGRAEPPDPAVLRRPVLGPLRVEPAIYLGSLGLVILVWIVLQVRLSFLGEMTATEAVALVFGTGLMGWFVWYCLARCGPEARRKMIVLMVLNVSSVVFWGLYEQSYGSWVAFSDRVMDRTALGVDWKAGQLLSLGGLFVMLLTPVFAVLWPWLDRRRWNPNVVAKFGCALALAGCAMGVLWWSTHLPGASGKVTVWWIVLAYLVLVAGEMMLSPIGLSAVTTLSVPSVVSLMMGVWFLASAFGEMLAGRFGTLASIPEGERAVSEMLPVYGDLFGILFWIGLAAGAVMLLLSPVLGRMLGGARRA